MAVLSLILLLACPGPPDDTHAEDSEVTTDSGDPALPDAPTHSLDEFTSAETCAGCHPNHYEQWRQSRHAYAMVDPLFQALVGIRRSHEPDMDERFCLQCHSAIGTRSGDIDAGFDFDALAPITMEGVTCQACHSVDTVFRTRNAGHLLDPAGPMRGPISDPMETTAHGSEHSEQISESSFCASCHDLTEVSGLPLERPYAEWLQSPAGEEQRPCQSCHMPTYEGKAALGGPDREVHSHRWLGVEDGLELLEGSATVQLKLPDSTQPGGTLPVVLTVRNEIDAHNFPTGSTFLRQFWLEVQVFSGEQRIYVSGQLDDNDDLMNHWSELAPYGDPDLVMLSSGLLDSEGQPTLFTHQAVEHASNALPPLHERTWTWLVDLPPDLDEDLLVTARLRFRESPPFLLRMADLPADLHIVDIDAAQGEVPLR